MHLSSSPRTVRRRYDEFRQPRSRRETAQTTTTTSVTNTSAPIMFAGDQSSATRTTRNLGIRGTIPASVAHRPHGHNGRSSTARTQRSATHHAARPTRRRLRRRLRTIRARRAASRRGGNVASRSRATRRYSEAACASRAHAPGLSAPAANHRPDDPIHHNRRPGLPLVRRSEPGAQPSLRTMRSQTQPGSTPGGTCADDPHLSGSAGPRRARCGRAGGRARRADLQRSPRGR